MARIWLLLLLVTLLAAGCTAPAPSPTTTPGGAPSPTPSSPAPTSGGDVEPLAVTAVDVPERGVEGEPVTFTVRVEGPAGETDHVGAHYATAPTSAPSASSMMACQHSSGGVPGSFAVLCTFADAGTYYLRAHVRTASGEAWGAEHTIQVRGSEAPPARITAEVPAQVTADQPFDVRVTVESETPFHVDHAHAHYGARSSTTPGPDAYPQSCQQTQAEAPGTFVVRCTLPAGTWYVRGEAWERLPPDGAMGGWSEEHRVVAS